MNLQVAIANFHALIEPVDTFDPRTWEEEHPEDVCYLNLSDRTDCYAILDRQDYEWAKSLKSGLWCHTYGSGSMDPETGTIQRPDGIYARKTFEGKTIFLHRCITFRAYGPPPLPNWLSDHMNGETLDCRRRNLQWSSRSGNARNTKGSEIRERYIREIGVSC